MTPASASSDSSAPPPNAERSAPAAPVPAITAAVPLLEALFDGQSGAIDLRALAPGKSPVQQIIPLGPRAGGAISAFVRQHGAERNIYFGVAIRKPDAKTGSGAECQALTALFAEIDFSQTPETVARERLATFPLRPSLTVRSGGGLHCYWLLAEPLSLGGTGLADAKVLLIALADAVGADRASAEPARILRLPGTWNFKYDPPREVGLE